MNDDPTNLSECGQTRREQILRLALIEARSRRSRRQIARTGAVAIIVVVISTILVLRPAERVPEIPVVVQRPAVPEPERTPEITMIPTDPTIVDRLAIPPGPRTWTSIGDDELLQALADAGKPAALIYHDGRATLLPR